MQAGFAKIDITPEPGAHIPGGFAPRIATGTHDPLEVRACVVAAAGTTLALVGVDAVSVPDDTVRMARSQVRIPALDTRDILIAASHTHCGGPANDVLGTDADADYQHRVAKAVSEAVVAAWEQRCPVSLAAGTAPCAGWAFNRRWVLPDGSQRTNPGKGNAEMIKPAGPVDPEIGVLGFRRRTDGTWLGALVNYTCHSTVMFGTEFSADYAGAWRNQMAERSANPDFCMVFMNGACGDINQLDFSRQDVRESGEAWVQRMGQALATVSWDTMTQAPLLAEETLASTHGTIMAAYRRLTPRQLAEAEELVKVKGDWESSHWLARDRLLLHERIGDKREREVPVDLYRIGPSLLAAAPWQPFCQFGLRVKAALPMPSMVIAFANGSIGYVPTPEALAAGGYEPRLCRGSCLVPPTGGQIVSEICTLAARMPREEQT